MPKTPVRAFLRFPGAAAPLQATKAKNQRSRNSYAGFRPRQSPARPKPRYNVKSRRRSHCSYFEDIGPSSFLHPPQACLARVPTRPSKIEKNRKPESHAEEPHCSGHVILFTALSATPGTFNSSSNILFDSPLSLTRSRLNQELVVNNALRELAGSGTGRGLDTYVHIPLISKFCLVNSGVTS